MTNLELSKGDCLYAGTTTMAGHQKIFYLGYLEGGLCTCPKEAVPYMKMLPTELVSLRDHWDSQYQKEGHRAIHNGYFFRGNVAIAPQVASFYEKRARVNEHFTHLLDE